MPRVHLSRPSRRLASVMLTAVAMAAMIAPAVPALAADQRAITPVELLDAPATQPEDPLGTPGAGSLVAAATLLTTGGSLRSAQQASADLTTATSTGTASGAVTLPDLLPQVETAAGRFTDDGAQRALGVRLSDMGGSAVLTVGSVSAPLENLTRGDRLTSAPSGGMVVQLSACIEPACSPGSSVAVNPMQPTGFHGPVIGVSAPAGAGATDAEWSLRAVGSSFQFINLLSGLCMEARGGNAVTSPCVDPAAVDDPSSAQLWDAIVGATGSTVIRTAGAAGGGSETLTLNGSGQFVLIPTTDVIGAGQSFGVYPVQQDGGVIPSWSFPNVSRDQSGGFDIAAGDLDRAVVNDGYRDEAVVAWAEPGRAVRIAVMDYSRPGMPIVTTTTVAGGTPTEGTASVEVGDFNGDGVNEIVVIHGVELQLQGEIYTYEGPGTLSRRSSFAWTVNGGVIPPWEPNSVSVAAGDFFGKGRDALAVLHYSLDDVEKPVVRVMSFGSDLAVTGVASQSIGFPTQSFTDPNTGQHPRGLRLVAAALDPAIGGTLNPARRQLVAAAPTPGNRACYQMFTADEPVAGSVQVAQLGTGYCGPSVPGNGQPGLPIQLAAGGFAGRAAESGTLPQWGVATLSAGSATEPRVVMLSLKNGALTPHDLGTTASSAGATATLTAFDQKNETLRLGAPLVVDLESLQTPTMVAAAPPAHVDWIYNPSAGKDGFVNVSASPNLAIAMSDSASSTFTSTSETTLGGSVSASTKATAKETLEGDALVASAKVTTQVTVSASATVAGADSSGSEQSSSKTTTSRSRTVTDDLLRLKVVSQRVFRYPILGGNALTTNPDSCGNDCHAYYDVYVPTSTAAVSTDVGGRTIDGYAPPWQNGNVLSYPTSPIEAPGAWSYVDDKGVTVSKEEYLLQQGFRLDGTSADTTLALTTIENSTHKSEVNATFKQGVEFKQTASATVDVGVAKETTGGTLQGGVDLSQSVSHTSTGKTTTTSTAGLELLAPAVSSGGYGFTTYYYYLDGVSKVNYSVDLAAVDPEFWRRSYGQQPDPALSLPNAVPLTVTGATQKPQFSTEFSRQRIRGFRALEPSPTGPQSAKEYTSAPRTGDSVTFAVDLHNYSLTSSKPTTVEFFAVPIDPRTMNPTGPAEPIGSPQTAPSMAPQGTTTAYSPVWTASGPAAQGASSDWNIFVVLNRQGQGGEEIHPLGATATGTHNLACPTTRGNDDFAFAAAGTVDAEGFLLDPMTGQRDTTACGQNNQGYGSITVLGKATAVEADAAPDESASANVQLAGAGFVTEDAAVQQLDETSPVPTLVEGVSTPGVVQVSADSDSAAYQTVQIFDGDPDQGGKMIASTTVQGTASETGGFARYSWIPTGVGEHRLYQKVLGSAAAGRSDAQIVTVNVVAQVPEDVDPTPSDSPSPDPTGTPAAADPASGSEGSLPTTGQTVPILTIALGAAALLLGGALVIRSRRRTRRRSARP